MNEMDVLPDLSILSTYDKCKYKVKLWEHEFKKNHGRLPSKLDIREASTEVRNAYKTYFRLKTAALEESLMHIDGFDAVTEKEDNSTVEHSTIQDESVNVLNQSTNTPYLDLSTNAISEKIWGSHLNNKETNSRQKSNCKSNSSNVNLSFSKKLFEGSKSSKRIPRKSLSFNRKKSESDSIKPHFFSQPDTSTSFLEISNEPSTSGSSTSKLDDLFPLNNVKITVPTAAVVSQPINIVQNSVDNNYKSVRRLDAGWIQRVTQVTETELLDNDLVNLNCDSYVQNKFSPKKLDYDSDDIIANSEDEPDDSCSFRHIAKRRKSINTVSVQDNTYVEQKSSNVKNALITIDTIPKRLDFSNIFTNESLNKNETSTSEYENKIKQNLKSNTKSVDVYEFQCDLDNQTNKNKHTVKSKKKPSKTKINKDISLLDTQEQSSTENESRLQLRNRNTKCFIFPDSSSNDDKEHIKKSKPCLQNVKDSKVKCKKPPTMNTEESQAETNNTTQTYELEYSIKPRIVTVPRIKNIKQAVAKRKTVKSTPESGNTPKGDERTASNKSEAKLKQKVESGTLNDNYVQINLKKKIYVRGKNTKTFSKYKIQQWKNKKNALYGPNMDMRGCDGGMLTCFNCGQVGHFARACKAGKGDSLLPLEEEEEEVCPYPTLEEAAKMAQESVLALRKPNQTLQTSENQLEINETRSEIDPSNENQLNDCNADFDDSDDDDLLAETERLEQEIRKIDLQKYIDLTTTVKSYYDVSEDGSLIDTPDEIYDTLNKFGYHSFRDGQEQAIMRILSGKSTLVTLSTGSGKSLCYQLPAYLYSQREPCISLIVSPLVSLMEDQVTGIPAFLKAACLHTNQTKTQRERIMEAITTGSLNILLVSPEAVVAGERSSGFGSLLRKLPPIAFACIDEAHCVSQWSHNFRPSYLKICRVLRERLGVNTVLGLTATATRATSDSIIQHLHIPDGRDGIITDVPLPNNLRLTVSLDAERDQALLALLLSERFSDCRSIIVYCTRREECQRVATFLRTCLKDNGLAPSGNKKRKRYNLQAEPYHAGMSASKRKSIQKAFMTGELRIVVATVAFGMGINKADIRAVIHYNMPMSFENYVQEIGRAGRDGLPAHCHLFLDSQGKDENELRRHIFANSTDRHVIRKLLRHCFAPCSCKTSCPRHEVAFSIQETVQALDIPEENIETLLCYLELHDKQYIELLSHAYVTCNIISYGGAQQIRKAAKDCPPLAMALALQKKKDDKKDNIFEFPVVEIASAMGWDSGICKHKLKNLEWITEKNQPKRSKLTVQFSNLGFRLLSPGNLSDSELDQALDSLFERVKEQEHTALAQLHAVHTVLTSVASPTFKLCISNSEVSENEQLLKSKIREYFECPKPLELLPEIQMKPIKEDQIMSDVRSLVCMYRDNSFSGRAVARIFHGIQSPNYPAFIWGRCKFWRAHLGTDFNAICQIATKEILRLR